MSSFVLPRLDPPGVHALPRPEVSATATYLDTADLRLARAGAWLRHRTGDEPPWTVRLPRTAERTVVPGTRQEISRPGGPGCPPEELVWLVATLTRGSSLAPVAVVRTVRRGLDLVGADGVPLARVSDDTAQVQVPMRGTPGRAFREILVERLAGAPKLLAGVPEPPAEAPEIQAGVPEIQAGVPELLSAVEERLLAAGARHGGLLSERVRALGATAAYPPDALPPAPRLPATARAADVVIDAVRAGVARVLAHDPLVRLDEPLPDGDTAVHQMRVGCRRLRSDLRTFAKLVDPRWARPLRAELRWLADRLAAPRDAEVLRERLHLTAAADPPLDGAELAHLDTILAARRDEAYRALQEALRTRRYLVLVQRLTTATRRVPLTAAAGDPAGAALPRLVGKPWRRLVRGGKGVPGAGRLAPDAPDVDWHQVRIHAKRARYAAEAAQAAGDPRLARLARALAKLQNLLGEHTDAALAAGTWLSLAAAHPDLAETCTRLAERDRAAATAVRAAYPARWHKTERKSTFLTRQL
ncbi:CYTH and CHAD domain-containing protein [Catellatospora sp. NPDC049609]|uniref:CYTH and CHAD domain-containing protein n=1 Tax=Catellatospora sp. NPDC049609 TaxID=3155505 RepID=UPI003447CB7C